MKPGIYHDLPMADYLAMPAASASMMLAMLERCPRAAWFESWLNPARIADASTKAQSVGTLAHELLLEGSTSKMVVLDPKDYPGQRGGIPDGWTNDNIRGARDKALAAGKIPVFPDVAAAVEAMVAEARAYLETVRKTEPNVYALFQPGGGESEVTIVWEEEGCLFRMRPDRLASGFTLQGDVKTTKTVAEPDRWGRTQLFGASYYIAAAFYRRGLERATGKRSPYFYLAQEQDAPHLCSLIGLDPAAQELGQRKAERAIATWKSCMKSGVFPGYPNRIAYPETPTWEFAREEAVEAHGIPYDPAKLWQKPAAMREDDPAYP